MLTYSAIFGYVPHEESGKLEQREGNHAERWCEACWQALKRVAIQLPQRRCKITGTLTDSSCDSLPSPCCSLYVDNLSGIVTIATSFGDRQTNQSRFLVYR